MRKILHTLPYYLVLLFFYWPFYELIFLLITDPLVQKGVLINNLFFYSPLATFLVSFLYCYRYHFTMWWLLGVALIFCFTILSLNRPGWWSRSQVCFYEKESINCKTPLSSLGGVFIYGQMRKCSIHVDAV